MADIRNDQYLHRPGAGRGAITPNDPLETRLFGPNGQPISVTSDKLDVRASELETILGEVSDTPTANTLADRLRRLEEKLALLESGAAKVQIPAGVDVTDRANRALGQVTLTGSNALLTTHQSAATANGNGTVATVTGYGSVRFRVSGAFSATVNFEASMDGTNWDPLAAINATTGQLVTSTTSPGVFVADIVGVQAIRARVSGYSSGSVTVTSRVLSLSSPTWQVPVQRTAPDIERVLNGVVIPPGSSASAVANIAGYSRIAVAFRITPTQNIPARVIVRPTVVNADGRFDNHGNLLTHDNLSQTQTQVVLDGGMGSHLRVLTWVLDNVYPAPYLQVSVTNNSQTTSADSVYMWLVKGV